jgi:hypothetical protein
LPRRPLRWERLPHWCRYWLTTGWANQAHGQNPKRAIRTARGMKTRSLNAVWNLRSGDRDDRKGRNLSS